VELAPYVDIFVLQVQRVQTDPQTVSEFVLPLAPKLRAANPDLQISIQVRTEGDVVAIADLVESLEGDLDGVSILTSPETVRVAEALVEELRRRTGATPGPASTPAATVSPTTPAGRELLLILGGFLLIAILVGGFAVFSRLNQDREEPP
jgi:hypothetical protein